DALAKREPSKTTTQHASFAHPRLCKPQAAAAAFHTATWRRCACPVCFARLGGSSVRAREGLRCHRCVTAIGRGLSKADEGRGDCDHNPLLRLEQRNAAWENAYHARIAPHRNIGLERSGYFSA